MSDCSRHLFHTADKTVSVYPSLVPDTPVVYLNTFTEESGLVHQSLCYMNRRDFTLVTISNLAWNHDMSPWNCPPIFKDDTPCTGGADKYLRLLTEEIIPQAEQFMKGHAAWRGIAGHSLAGLFALYSLYHTDLFTRAASVSGSLWFPDFQEYVSTHEMKNVPECIYLSLGDRECRTRNAYLKTVQTNTEELYTFYQNKGIPATFRLHPGSHFHDTASRTAAGIAWITEYGTAPGKQQTQIR